MDTFSKEENKELLGAIVGDLVASSSESSPAHSRFTGATVMTLAVAEWLMSDPGHSKRTLVECMQRLGRRYPDAGYDRKFSQWLQSGNPRPYGSFGIGAAMRVSPVGLYADSLEEALELARITASVTHNRSDGIKGAQAIAGCVFIKKTEWAEEGKIRRFIREKIGYDLDFKQEDIRDGCSFDGTCLESVPVAIKAYLERSLYPPKVALDLAVSMGGGSNAIASMTASIAGAERFGVIGIGFGTELIGQCRALLPADLLDINDRFQDSISRPLRQSYYLHGKLFAGEYPGDKDEETARRKINNMVHFGVRHFVDLTEEGELRPYSHLLPKGTTYLRFPIPDGGVPQSMESVSRLLDKIADFENMEGYTYIHCWGGVGRTGTIVGCLKARELRRHGSSKALTVLRNFFKKMPKSAYRKTPDTPVQEEFVRAYERIAGDINNAKAARIKDCIRGSLMAGAVGDALGYAVEFMSRKSILARYGDKGITKFDLTTEDKALVSDDTQMTLFTANGMLRGVTRGYMRGIGGAPEDYVAGAYLDWYYTQTGKKWVCCTWLRDLPELAHRRAPGNTCLEACEAMLNGTDVKNYSKGCGGLMRVAPMALLMSGYLARGERFYSIAEMDTAGAETARVTHKHPLGFLPAAMLTHLLYKLVPMSVEAVSEEFEQLIEETVEALDSIYKDEFAKYKRRLADITRKAVALANNDRSDADNIRSLGEGWTGEEAWAIAVYCAMRHADSVEDAIIAAVNHDGDSDSTGSICGNIMGAIYGYEAVKYQRLFCPQGKELEQTLELSNIILALADDLYTSCIIDEYDPIDTPEKQQWYERYCKMNPVGI